MSLRDELHIRVNNWLKNSVPEQRVIEEHILKSDTPYVQKPLAKFIFDALLKKIKWGTKIGKIKWGTKIYYRITDVMR